MKQYKTDNQLIYEAYQGFGKNPLYDELVDDVAMYIRKCMASSKACGVLIWEGQRIDLKKIFSGLTNIAKELLNVIGIGEDEEEIDIAKIMQQVQEYSGIYGVNGREYNLPGAYVFAIDDIILAAFADINVFEKWVKIEEESIRASCDESMVSRFRTIVKIIHARFDAR